MRYARRVDANLDEIVAEFNAAGCAVDRTNRDWDLTVQYGGITMLIEVKDGRKAPSARKLTRREIKTHDRLMIRVVNDCEQAREAARVLQCWSKAIQEFFRGA